MHGRMARYTYSGDAQELTSLAEEGILPILQGISGFKAYSILVTDANVISFSAWETAADAEEANKAVAAWVAENMADRIKHIETQIGEVTLSTTLGVSTKAGATA